MANKTIVPDGSSEPVGAINSALGESDTTFIVFRSDASNESLVSTIVDMAISVMKMDADEYRIIWVKSQAVVPDFVAKYFPAGKPEIVAVSLCSGVGLNRDVKDRYTLKQLPDEKSLLKAFAAAAL